MSNETLIRKLNHFQQHASDSPCRVSVHLTKVDQERPGRMAQIANKAMLLIAFAGISAGAGFTLKSLTEGNAAAPATVAATSAPAAASAAETAETAASAARVAETKRQDALEKKYLNEKVSPEDQLREKLNYVEIEYMGKKAMALDVPSRVMLTKAAAKKYNLESTGLNWKDLYGVIHAETAWVSRDGMGLNGKVSRGLAQMEDATAKSLGIKNPNDPVDAAFGAAKLLKEAAGWSHNKISRLGLRGGDRHEALRDGISVYYNLSSKKRAEWDGTNNHQMPYATQRHIENVKDGAALASRHERTLIKESKQQDTKKNEMVASTSETPATSAFKPGALAIVAKFQQMQADQDNNQHRRETMRG